MRSIVFNVKPGVGPEDREALLDRLARLSGIQRAVALRPGAKNAAVQRMCYAEVTDEADIESLRGHIAALPEVESAELPAERRLV